MSTRYPVVVVHGLIGRFAGDEVLELLGPAPVVAPHLLGYGTTGRPAQPLTVALQADWVASELWRVVRDQPVHIVGHSIGAVVAAVFAHEHPERVVSFSNVEGNFTLADAFMSARIAAMPLPELAALIEEDRSDPVGWLQKRGISATPQTIRMALDALQYQSPETVRQMARATVEFTADAGYETLLRDVFARVPVHLVAGQRSRPGWHVPSWAIGAARSYAEVPGAGHFLAIEQPAAFGRVLAELLAATEIDKTRTDLEIPNGL